MVSLAELKTTDVRIHDLTHRLVRGTLGRSDGEFGRGGDLGTRRRIDKRQLAPMQPPIRKPALTPALDSAVNKTEDFRRRQGALGKPIPRD